MQSHTAKVGCVGWSRDMEREELTLVDKSTGIRFNIPVSSTFMRNNRGAIESGEKLELEIRIVS